MLREAMEGIFPHLLTKYEARASKPSFHFFKALNDDNNGLRGEWQPFMCVSGVGLSATNIFHVNIFFRNFSPSLTTLNIERILNILITSEKVRIRNFSL